METREEKDTLGDRMKVYEAEALSHDRDVDGIVVLRLDGCHFHTWTKAAKVEKPFDGYMIKAMQSAAKTLCEQIPSCIMAYTQSDEITIVLRKGNKETSEPWYANRIQKLCSVSAAICSVAFNDEIRRLRRNSMASFPESLPMAVFDSRVMFLPDVDEVINNIIWRQNDCIKNSVSAMAQSFFSPKELLNKNQAQQLEMMRVQRGFDWNGLPAWERLGTLVHKRRIDDSYQGVPFSRGVFYIDDRIPRFTEDRQFLLDAYNFTLETRQDGSQDDD